MKKLLLGILVLLWSVAAQAQTPSFYQLTDSASTAFKVRVFTCQTIYICPVSVSSDTSGNPLSGTVGTTNPNGTAMYVQGVTGGIPILAAQSGAWSFSLGAGSNAIGSITNTGFTAAQSGAWTVGLSAGAAAIGSITNTTFAATQSGTWNFGLTTLNGVALGSPSNYGTSPGAVAVPGVNAFITNSPTVTQSGTWTVQPGNVANTTAWLVTGTGGTFPATQSGAWSVAIGSSLPAGAAAIGTVSLNAALPAGANTIGAVTQASGPWTSNVTQFGGSAVVTGAGVGGVGIPRVTISSDSSLAANQSVNTAQVNGITTSTGAGAAGTGSQRVAVAQDATTVAGSASIPSGTNLIGKTGIDQTTPGTTNRVQATASQVWKAGTLQGLTWGTAGFSTEVNSVVTGNCVLAASALNNSTALDQYFNISISFGSITTGSGAPSINFYLYQLNQDGTTYGDGRFGTSAAGPPPSPYFVGAIGFGAAVTAVLTGSVQPSPILLPPGQFKLVMCNSTGATLAASSNTVSIRTYNSGLN